MIFSMHIQSRALPALVEKVIQTTRVRGFLLRSLDVKSCQNGQQLRINLTVEGNRPPARLLDQLDKINGILELTSLHAVEDASSTGKAVAG